MHMSVQSGRYVDVPVYANDGEKKLRFFFHDDPDMEDLVDIVIEDGDMVMSVVVKREDLQEVLEYAKD